jgi:hypothetical protein
MANPLIAEFWRVVLPIVATERPTWANRAPAQYWIHSGSGVPGFKYSLWVKQESAGCGLLIDRGGTHTDWNKSVFDCLKRKEHQIERAFGDVLGWYRLDDKHVSVVEAVVAKRGYSSSRIEWTTIAQRLARQLLAFERAIQPHLILAADANVVVPDLAEQVESGRTFAEGATTSVVINAYERSPAARLACLDHWGHQCAVCGILLAEMYGAIADGFILCTTFGRSRILDARTLSILLQTFGPCAPTVTPSFTCGSPNCQSTKQRLNCSRCGSLWGRGVGKLKQTCGLALNLQIGRIRA